MHKLIEAAGLENFNAELEKAQRDGYMPMYGHRVYEKQPETISLDGDKYPTCNTHYSVLMYNPNIQLSLIQLEKQRIEWSKKTFTEATSASAILKLKEELKEIEMDIVAGERKPEEFADAMMCLFDIAGRLENPITPEEIIIAFKEKLEVNISSEWVKQPDNTYKRIKK